MDSLITSDINTSSDKILNNPWRGAEAWHYYILCQRQLYAGQFKSALKTALRLTDYELDMDPKKIYTLVALSAYYNKVINYFINLELQIVFKSFCKTLRNGQCVIKIEIC